MKNMNSFKNVILVDENDNAIGLCDKQEAHKTPCLHRAFSIFIFNHKGKLLLQKRNENKYHSGGLWTNTCCGHPQRDTDLMQNATVRLIQEMGIICPLKHLFSFCYKTKLKDLYEYEYDHVLIGFTELSPHINKLEVSEWKWESLKLVKEQNAANSEQYTYWFKYIIDNYLDILQDEIDKYLTNVKLNPNYNENLYLKQIHLHEEIMDVIHKELIIDYNLPKQLIKSIEDSIKINGKCKRSHMLYLCSQLISDANIKDLSYIAASIELMQNASLIHDDIIDNGETRRGVETINKKYGTNVAIISGDYVIFNSYNILSCVSDKNQAIHIMKMLNKAYIDMCLGLRMEEKIVGNFSFDENYYITLIERKTASFFASVCASGAILAHASEEKIQLLHQFGYFYGLAYQIKDDLMPFISNPSKTNKDIDADMKNKLVTLPYLYCYNELNEQNQLLMKCYFEENQCVEPEQIYRLVNSTTAINRCLILVVEYVYSALNILENFNDSKTKQELKQLTIKLLQ